MLVSLAEKRFRSRRLVRYSRPVGRQDSVRRPVPSIELRGIFNRRIAAKRVDWVPASVTWTEKVDDILKSDADVIVELVGGLHPAYEWVRSALESGKAVVTANKQLIAHYGTELGELARARGVQLRFEASVAGGIPVLRALQEGLAATGWSKSAAFSTARVRSS